MAGNKEAFQKAMNQGHSAAWDQEWEKAAGCYHTALAEFPNHPLGLSSLGLALFELQDFPAALQCYQKAAALTPEDPVPHEKTARIYERMGRLNEAVGASLQAAEMHLKARSADKAIDNWQRVLSIQPENATVRTRLAAVYEKLGRREEAVSEYISTASIFQRHGDLNRAARLVEYAQRIAPENQEVRLAHSLLRGGQQLPRPSRSQGGTGPARMAQVRSAGEPAGESQTDPIGEARQRAMVQLAGLLFDQAEENTAAGPARGRGLTALARGKPAESSDSSERTRIILHLGQAIDSQSQGDHAQAIVELDHAIQLGLHQPAASFDIGLLSKDDDPEKALKFLQQSSRHPDFALASHLLIGQLQERGEQWQEAAGSYLQALAIADATTVSPDQCEELLSQYDALADATAAQENSSLQAACKAVSNQLLRPEWSAYLRKTRENLPPQPEGSPPALIAEMVLEMRSTQVVDAMTQARKLASVGYIRSALEEAMYGLQHAPTYLPLHVLIADLLLQDAHLSDAVHKYLVVSELYSVRGETVRAMRILRRVSQLLPMDVNIRLRLINLLVTQEKVDEALQEYSGLADLYYRLTDFDKARQTYLDALNIARRSKDNRAWGVNLLLKVADIDMQRLNLRQALRVYEQIRTIQPDNAPVRAQIIHLNFRLGQEPSAIKELDEYLTFLENAGRRQAAVDFVSELLVEHAGRIDLRRRMADLYLRNNQTAEAVTQLDAGADILLSAGKHLEAINLLETIISLKPANVSEYQRGLELLRREMLRK